MNRFHALKIFCTAAERLHFGKTAQHFAVSPQVVSRIIGELETHLGEILFVRNTRSVRLTPFGEQFYVKAKRVLADSDELFAPPKQTLDEMAGVVCVTMPIFMQYHQFIHRLLEKLSQYPNIILEWQMSETRADVVAERIDVGVRLGVVADNRFVVKRICPMGAKVVATPELIERLGRPKDLADLQQNYPLSGHLNSNSGHLWPWQFADGIAFTPQNPKFIAHRADIELAATLSGQVVSHLPDHIALPYIKRGELVSLLDEYAAYPWQLYVYRPPQTLDLPRVKLVFDELAKILAQEYAANGLQAV
ncbi:DNA-binding transcriptional regulator, LysR family [Pasteurella testudinis DSM 23072]|uniref:DNA-binding transcriptional regulator, LysR family n=1 Tax=Pasteurella testudinis DSM 23072 TaxID=1122938 RepID=A0A1W1ULE9_9PAST|nr:LysR family transcriptional regulator [Pasteurella testudinis]SMB81829.1 DNA-binding transcriptional regulator, LysR family [Pasteurella testudinis DSM 23072]SUB50300.1 glycine cleavage system transcriptional activator [Pasteurella testudinis]